MLQSFLYALVDLLAVPDVSIGVFGISSRLDAKDLLERRVVSRYGILKTACCLKYKRIRRLTFCSISMSIELLLLLLVSQIWSKTGSFYSPTSSSISSISSICVIGNADFE